MRPKRSYLLELTVVALAGVVAITVDANAADQALVQAFSDHVEQLEGMEASVKQTAQRQLGDDALDLSDRLTEALGSLYPDYSQAMAVADRDSTKAAVDGLTPLTQGDDLFLAADASFYLARALMNDEQFESALPLLERLTGELADVSLHQDVAKYYAGVAQAGLLKNEAAATTLTDFLKSHPDAPERLRVSAWRKVQELEAIEAGKLDDVYQRMDFSRRRLEQVKTDEATQEQQDKVVKLLNQLIKEEEKKECSGSCKNNTKKQQDKQPKQQVKNEPKPGKPSKSDKGGSSSNANGTVVDKSYDDAPASPWSRLRDRSRDPANNAVKDKLPARYRDIVEKYYEAANGNSE